MIKSMTGYGRAQQTINGRDVLVEIKSVNHRYFEFSARVPRAYGYLEEKLKSLLQQHISRGKVEVSVIINALEGQDVVIELNDSVVRGYLNALRNANQTLWLADDLTLSCVARFPDAFSVQKAIVNEDEIWKVVEPTALAAIQKFVDMREYEGSKLSIDIQNRSLTILNIVEKIEQLYPLSVENYRQRLFTKLTEIIGASADPQRILTEAAIFADKVAVDEETVRLRSHINQITNMLSSDDSIGKKLDFIIQEVNREVNTIGSKSQDIEITKLVVDLKAEIEKIREQVQNIE